MSIQTVDHLQPLQTPFDLTAVVKRCGEMDGETLGAYCEENWGTASGNAKAMGFLIKEMHRKFTIRDRHKQADGGYVKVRGFTSFEKWVRHFTGMSARTAYHWMESEEKKHKRNETRRSKRSMDFLKRDDFPLVTMERFEKAAHQRSVSVKDWASEVLRAAVKDKP